MSRLTLAKVLVGLVALPLLLSLGGAQVVATPVLLPLALFFARRSGRIGRAFWAALSALMSGAAAWVGAYLLWGEGGPTAVAGLAALVGVAVLVMLAGNDDATRATVGQAS